MIRLALLGGTLLALGASLGACSSDAPEGPAWYERGDVSYDSLKAAADACKAQGGDFELKKGGDPTHMGDYECRPAKGT